MKTRKYILTALANYIPVLCACLFYRGGAYIWPVFMVLQILLVIINHKITDNRLPLLILHANLLVSAIIANWLLTHLYYTRISPDGITPILGLFGGFAGAIFVILLSVISLLIRIYKKRKA